MRLAPVVYPGKMFWDTAVIKPVYGATDERAGFGCKYVQWRMQVRAMAVASTCDDGCKYVRLYKACTGTGTFS